MKQKIKNHINPQYGESRGRPFQDERAQCICGRHPADRIVVVMKTRWSSSEDKSRNKPACPGGLWGILLARNYGYRRCRLRSLKLKEKREISHNQAMPCTPVSLIPLGRPLPGAQPPDQKPGFPLLGGKTREFWVWRLPSKLASPVSETSTGRMALGRPRLPVQGPSQHFAVSFSDSKASPSPTRGLL